LKGPDVLVLAGDISTGARYHKLLRLFDDFPGPRLFVPGNHDLWSRSRQPDTPRRYRRALRNIAEESDFHYLPGDPICVDGVGFAGTVGWYDYSFRQVERPHSGASVTPLWPDRRHKGTASSSSNRLQQYP
jgi:predicted phosphohydrolase